MDKTPGTDAAIEKMLAAITDDAVGDTYPSGTSFVPADAPWSAVVAMTRLRAGAIVVLVGAEGAEDRFSNAAREPMTCGAMVTDLLRSGYIPIVNTKPVLTLGPDPELIYE